MSFTSHVFICTLPIMHHIYEFSVYILHILLDRTMCMVHSTHCTAYALYSILIEDAVPSRTLRSSASRQCTLKESTTVLCYGTSLRGRFGRLQPKHGTLYRTMSGWLINSKLSDPVSRRIFIDFCIASCSLFPSPRIAYCYIWCVKINVLLLLVYTKPLTITITLSTLAWLAFPNLIIPLIINM